VAGAAIAAIAGSGREATYQSQVTMLVGPPGTRLTVLRAAGQRGQTYAELATSRPVLEAARRRLGLSTSVDQLRSDVRATADDVTRVLTITARAGTARDAQRLAAALPEELARAARDLERTTAPADSRAREIQLRLVDAPETPKSSVGAGTTPMIVIAGFTGALVAFTLLLLADAVRGRVRGPHELADATEAPFMGEMSDPEGDRLVATRVRLAQATTPLRSLLVAGIDGAGAGETAVRLAEALARDGARTVLVDGDHRDREASRYLNLHEHPGVAELLSGGQSSRALRDVILGRSSGLQVVPAGQGRVEPGEEALRALLRRLSASADLVVVSAGGHEPSPAGLRWARATSGTFIVARQDRALRDRASLAADAFRQVGAEVRGAILTTPAGSRSAYLVPASKGREQAQKPGAQDTETGSTRERTPRSRGARPNRPELSGGS
jgi:Mrp family chromosome partitioning ATPase